MTVGRDYWHLVCSMVSRSPGKCYDTFHPLCISPTLIFRKH